MQAEAREEVRQRVEQQRRRREAEETLERRTRRRPSWEDAPDELDGLWYQLFGARAIIGAGMMGLWLIVSAVIWLATNLRLPIFYAIRSLDIATGGRAIPIAPWLMWALWGAIFGGALGYWLVAPLYGNRENRSFILLVPLLAMTLCGALLWAFVR